MKVTDIKIEEINHKKLNDNLKKVISYMEKDNIENPLDLLPNTPSIKVSFKLTDTFSSFANCVRRVLMEELPVKCLDFENFITDDKFIISDLLQKNINLIPINQDIDLKSFEKLNIGIYKSNFTNAPIDIKAKDILITKDKLVKDKKPVSIIDIEKLIPNNNIKIITLNPGCTLLISKLDIISGLAIDDYGKFSLLNNVTYTPCDYESYDNYDKKGIMSSKIDPSNFKISFTTCGNVEIKYIINLLIETVCNRLEEIKNKLVLYSQSNLKNYTNINIEVKYVNEMYTYEFKNEYISIIYMIAQQCYLLDKNIKHCSRTVKRYDINTGIINIIHPEPNKILISSVDLCIKNIKELKKII